VGLVEHGVGCSCVGHQCRRWLRYYPEDDQKANGFTLKLAHYGVGAPMGTVEPSRSYDVVAADADFWLALSAVRHDDPFLTLVGWANRTVVPRDAPDDRGRAARPDRLVVDAIRKRAPLRWQASVAQCPQGTLGWLLDLTAEAMARKLGARFGLSPWADGREALPPPEPEHLSATA
jgi:hypothetical protein